MATHWPSRLRLLLLLLASAAGRTLAACGRCMNADKCDPSVGYCTDFLCEYGWTNQPLCNATCPPLTWGINCQSVCHCPPNANCSNVNGACSTESCATNWYGSGCQYQKTELYSPPTVAQNYNSSGALVQWQRWSSYTDYGDGPVVSYTLQACQGPTSPTCWQMVGTVPEPSSASPSMLSLWAPGVPNTTYSYRVIANTQYLGNLVTGTPGRASQLVLLPPLPSNSSSPVPAILPVSAVAASTTATSAFIVWQLPTAGTGGSSGQSQVVFYNVTYALLSSLASPNTCRATTSAAVLSESFGSIPVYAPLTSVTVSPLLPYSLYTVTIWAVYSGSNFSNATTSNFSTMASAPSTVPGNITISNLTSNAASIGWLSVACRDITGPFVRFDLNFTTDDGSNTGVVIITDPSATSARLTGLLPLTWYGVTVRLVTAAGAAPWSSVQRFQTPNEVPAAVSMLAVGNVTQVAATARWVSSAPNFTVTLLNEGPLACGSTSNEILVWVNRTQSTSYNLLGLQPWVRYHVQVIASNEIGNSASTTAEFVSKSSVPNGSVTGLALNYIPSSNRLSVTWTPFPCGSLNGVFLRYDVMVSVNGSPASSSPSSGAWLEIPDVLPSANYSVQVRVVNDAGAGNFSSAVTIVSPYKVPPSPVTNITVVNASPAVVNVSWSPSSGNQGASYLVTCELLVAGTCLPLPLPRLQQTTTLSGGASLVLGGLRPWSSYRLTITATNDAGSATAAINFTTQTSSANTPVTDVQVTNVTSSTAVCTWQQLACDAWTAPNLTYRYTVRELASGTVVISNTTSGSTVWLTSLQPYRMYGFSVQVVTGTDVGPMSAIVTFTTQLARPPMVQRIYFNITSPSTVLVQWPIPLDGSLVNGYYLVYQRLIIGDCSLQPGPAVTIVVGDRSASSVSLDQLQPWSTYEVWLSAFNLVGYSPNVSAQVNLPYDVPAAAPVNLTGSAVAGAQLVFSWALPDCLTLRGSVIGYDYLLLLSSSAAVIKNDTTRLLNVSLGNLSAYMEYTFSVRIRNAAGSGPASTTTLRTLPAEPAAPSDIQSLPSASGLFDAATQLWIGFSNTDVTNVIGYRLSYRAVTESSSAVTVQGPVNGSRVEVLLSNLLPFTMYQIQVQLGTAAGWSQNVSSVNLSTDSARPSSPRSVVLSNLTETSLSVGWNIPSPANGPVLGYRVSYAPCSPEQPLNCSYRNSVNLSSTSQQLHNLCPGSCYSITVAAATDKGFGSVATLQLWTIPGLPVTPVAPKLIFVTTTTATVKIYPVPPLYGPVISYQISALKSSHTGRRRRQAASSGTTPSGVSSQALVYAQIPAAEVPYDGYLIVIGDNRTTASGRYISKPLDPGTSYDIILTAVSTLNNITRSSSSTALAVVTSDVPVVTDAASNVATTPFWVPIVIAVILFVVLVAAIVVLIVCLRRKRRSSMAKESSIDDRYENSDNDLAQYRDQLELINGDSLPIARKNDSIDMATALQQPIWHGYWSPTFKLESPRYVLTPDQPGDVASESLSISFEQEFNQLPRGQQAEWKVALRPANAELNRVDHILPYDHSRVKLRYRPPATGTDYINASYVRGYDNNKAYIATTCPFNDKSRVAFWYMVVQENINDVVMVTNVMDEGIVKMSQFWPAVAGASEAYGETEVHNSGSTICANFTVHRLHLLCSGGGDGFESLHREVTLYHFTSWPQHGVPSDPLPFLEFCHVVRNHSKPRVIQQETNLMAVLCGTGVSTTGVFIAVDFLMDQAAEEEQVSMYQVVRRLREDRVHMVRTLRQYYFLYDVLFEHMISHRMSCMVLQLKQHYKGLSEAAASSANQPVAGRSGFSRQFSLLNYFTVNFGPEQCRDALLAVNRVKNRDLAILPPDAHRPVLRGAGGAGNDYINAVFADSYTVKSRYIITQTPLETTVVDFWKLVYEHNVVAIVSLDDRGQHVPPLTDDPFSSWLPMRTAPSFEHLPELTDAASVYGPFVVKCVGQQSAVNVTERKLLLTNKLQPTERPCSLKQLQLSTWPLSGNKPPKTAQALLTLQAQLDGWLSAADGDARRRYRGSYSHRGSLDQQPWDSEPVPPRVLVHCNDGASRSGLFVASCTLCERIRLEPAINVCLVVKALRARRPQAVVSEEQYKFLHRLAWDYYHTNAAHKNGVPRTSSRAAKTRRQSQQHVDEAISYNKDGFDNDLDTDKIIGDGPRQKKRLVP